MKRSEGFEKVIKSINIARQSFSTPEEDKSVRMGGSSYTYSSLKAYLKSCQEPLRQQGVEIMVSPIRADDGTWTLEMILQHIDGPWVSFENPIFEDGGQRGDRNKAFGSGSTYAWRYLLRGSLGLGDVDTGAPFIDDEGDAAFPASNIGKKNLDVHPRNARKPKNSAPQQKPSVPSNTLQSVMGWGELPQMTKILQGLADKVEKEGLKRDQILKLTRIRILKLLETLGPIEGRKWSTETTKSMRSVGNTEECVDLVAMCALIDSLENECALINSLENEAAHDDAAPF